MDSTLAHENRLTTMEGILRELQRLGSDHEKRLRLLERIAGYGTGFIGAGLFVAKLLHWM